ncbi:MAG: c-type cytochrome, partial [Bdellovibrionota bacterium]
MKLRTILLTAVVVAAGAVAAVVFWPQGGHKPEPIVAGRDSCDRCHMQVGRPGFAAEFRDPKGNLTKYDDIGCMLLGMWELHQEVSDIYAEDHESGELIPFLSAHLVRGKKIETPMGYGIVAFKDEAAADAFAAANSGEKVTLEQVLKDTAWFQERQGGALAATPGGKRPFSEGDVKAGKAVFLRECAACHGDRGDGEGTAAAFIDPQPRDFLQGKFRFRTTPTGTPPATADVLRTIEEGVPGTAMPAFSFLTDEEKRQVAAYVLEKADVLATLEPELLPLPPEPPAATPESLARGQELFKNMACAQCHGTAGKGDGPTAKMLKDEKGRSVRPRDFTTGVFHGGNERKDVYYRIFGGMDGSPMVSFLAAVPEAADQWALVDYVLSLGAPAAPKPFPADPIQAGRLLASKYSCRGCHVLDDGKGGDAGPDLRISGQK